MDWKLFATTFITLFIAEFGDKTQLAAMAASAHSKGAWEVAVAVVLGLAFAGILGFIAGRILSDYLTPAVLRYGAGGLFILMGIWILFKPP